MDITDPEILLAEKFGSRAEKTSLNVYRKIKIKKGRWIVVFTKSKANEREIEK